jgi:Holliday junction resolvasome RuvABC endonuclease subunit
MEGYSFGSKMAGGSQSHSLGEAGGTIKLALFDGLLSTGWPIVAYPSLPVPSQVKKFAAGSGTVPKDQVSKHVFKKWDVDAADNNQADAYVLARIALALVTGETLTYEKAVIDAMRKSGSVHAEAPPELQYESRL